MIEGFLGLPGMGKTYLMVKRGLKLQRKGRLVVANFAMEGAERFSKIQDIFELENAVILLDEASLALPAQVWKDIPFEVMSYWRQHRHNGVEIYFTAQDFSEVAKPLRSVTQFVNHCVRIGPSSRPWAFKWRTTDGKGRVKYGGGFHLFDKDIANAYNTHEQFVVRQDYIKGAYLPKSGESKGAKVDAQA